MSYWCHICKTIAQNVKFAEGPNALIVCHEGKSHIVVDPDLERMATDAPRS